ncbi:NAD(P)H-dependent oxidoreductase [Patescibacteria group bacterium]|nr:NAD(P)H-dependent oxidoreductase [Patescibacteria group bacterium]
MLETFLANLKWRHATKEFDERKDVSKEDLQKITEAIRYAPSSRGLQLYHVFIIKNKDLRNKIKAKAYLQPQITTASYLMIFCAYTERVDINKRIDDYLDLVSSNNESEKTKLQSLETVLKESVQKKSDTELAHWATKQVYIALGFALAACAELKIDSCPMEGFEKEAIDKILQLPSSLKSTVFLAVGYRQTEPTRKKVRFPEDDLFSYL